MNVHSTPSNITARRIGLISDTHNLLRPGAVEYLQGCGHIVHAGDICNESVLEELGAIAPLTVVRGNNDRGTWAERLPESELLRVNEALVLVIHDLAQLTGGAIPDGVRVIISGHSHKPSIKEHRGILYINPGSAGPRRFKLPISLGELLVEGASVEARLVEV